MNHSAERKRALRAELKRVLPEGDPAATRDAVSRWLGTHPEAVTIAAFSPLPDEIDLLPLFSRHPGRRWVFPRVEGEKLVFQQIRDPVREFSPGAFNIREPLVSLPVVPVEEIDVFLCPGLAFDKHGGRLGRGRGFYDRMLAAARPGAWKIGVTLPSRIVETVYAEPHDIPMDAVISR